MKILNLYAGIGGNRKNWNGDKHEITNVEWDKDIAQVLRDEFPKDNVIVADAHKYLKENYQNYDFIWASPPCPTHSKMRKHLSVEVNNSEAVYPDMKLWQEVIFLKGYFDGNFVVENVNTWYDPLIKPQKSGRHYFWSNFSIPNIEKVNSKGQDVQIRNPDVVDDQQKEYGYDLSKYDLSKKQKKKMLNNCVHPKIGEAILKARSKKQTRLDSL